MSTSPSRDTSGQRSVSCTTVVHIVDYSNVIILVYLEELCDCMHWLLCSSPKIHPSTIVLENQAKVYSIDENSTIHCSP